MSKDTTAPPSEDDFDIPQEDFGPRLLVDECRQIRVARLLEHHGRPKLTDLAPTTRFRSGAHKFRVPLVSTPLRRGVRWWFACPTCGGRCAVLYSPCSLETPNFACRRCWGVAYPSQRARKQLAAPAVDLRKPEGGPGIARTA